MKLTPTLRAILATAALSLTAAIAVARSTELKEPPRTEIVLADSTKQSTLATVRRAIIAGGAGHGWKPVADKPGDMTLSVSSNGHKVTVDVLYDAKSFQVKYKGSSDMNEERSGDRITVHPKVNKWLDDLNEDIRAAAVAGVGSAN